MDEQEVLQLAGVEPEQEAEETITTDEWLERINDNQVSLAGIHSALVGMLIGVICAVELLRIWVQY